MTDSRLSKLPAFFDRARHRVSRRVQGVLCDVRLTDYQWRILDYIHNTPRPDLAQLKTQVSTAAGSLRPILDALAKAGLIEYQTHPQDETRQTVKITSRGLFVLQRINPKVAFLYSQFDTQRQSPPVKNAIKTVTQLLDADNTDKKNY